MDSIGVGLIGYKFMGRAHSNAYRQVRTFFPEAPTPRMVALCGRDERAVREAADQLGWAHWDTDWRNTVHRPDVDLVDVSTPGYLHREVVLEALSARKHVYCEKPLANTLAEAAEMLTAWRQAGTISMINFNYRRVPAVELAKRIVAEGRLGKIRHFRARYLQDWLVDANAAMSWRLRKETAGSGALGDIAAHSTDLARYLIGDIIEVVGTLDTFVPQRPSSPITSTIDSEYERVTVDDHTSFLARFACGATGTFEASRLAAGRRNTNTFEINGELGTISFDLERLNELQVYFVADDPEVQGFRTVSVSDSVHPYVDRWWPVGHSIGWEHSHVHMVYDLLQGIARSQQPAPSFLDGYQCQAVLDAVERSVESRTWESPTPPPAQ